MEVDFKELKRKDLQRLCKKHGLRANATNLQMADSLVSLFKICEKNEQDKVHSKGSGGSRSNEVERVKGDAEKVVIVIDEDEDEPGSVLLSADSKSSPKSRRSSEKDEQIEARLEGSSRCGGSEGTKVKWLEENVTIFLDEEDDEPGPVLRSADRKNSRRSSRWVGKVCEPSRSNEENQPVSVLKNPKGDLLVPARITRSRSMNSEVVHSPVIEKKKVRKDRQVARQNAELPSGAREGAGDAVGTIKENLSVMMAAVEVKVKRKRNSRNSSTKVNDETMVSLPIEVSDTENLVGDVVHEKHVNTGMGSDITLSIDGKQARQGNATRNEQDIEEHELSTAGSSMEIVPGSVGTKRGKKRTRAGFEEDNPVVEKEIDKLGSSQHPEFALRDELVEPEVYFASSQVLGTPSPSNLALSRPCLLLSELQGGQDEGEFPVANEPLNKQSASLNRNGDLELEESLVCKNSNIASITLVEVDDSFGRRLSTSELDHVSKDGAASQQSSATALSYSQGHHDIKECFCSDSANLVGNLEDSCKKCFIAEVHHNRSAETPVSLNGLSLSSEQGCETLESACENRGVEAKLKCQDFEEVGGGKEGEKRELFKDHEAHKEEENGSECQEGYNEKISGNCDFEKAIIEYIWEIASPASERTDEMNNNALLSVNIDGHDDHNLFYLEESNSETVGREESQVVVQKQDKDLKTLVEGRGAAFDENNSIELEYIAGALKKPGNIVVTWQALEPTGDNCQEQAADYGQAGTTATMKIVTDSSDRHNNLELQELIIFRNSEATRNPWTEEKNDSCYSQLSSTYMTKIIETEQEPKASLSSEKERIDPQSLIVSLITHVSTTVVSDHFGCSEFDGKDAEGTKGRDYSEICSVGPDIKMLSDCKAHLYAEEMGDVKFLETKQSHAEPIDAEDGKVQENGSNLSPYGNDEKTTNFKEKSERFQKFPGSQRLAEIKSGQVFAPFESVILQEELYQIKGGGPFIMEDNDEIIQDKLNNDGEKLCSSEPKAVGYDEDSEAKKSAGSSLAKVEEIAPFGLSKRVDNLMEKLLCLKKVLRGEIAPLVTDSSLLCEKEISCEEYHATSKKEMTSGGPCSAHEQESQVLNALMPTDPVHEDCEQDSSNSEVNIPNKVDEVSITSLPHPLQGNPDLWKCMESCEGNDTDAVSPNECDFYISSTEGGDPCQDGDVDDREFLEIVQDVTAKPGEVLEDNKFVSPCKLGSFDLEVESSSASCISKSKLNNSITNSPAKYIKHFGTKCLPETLDSHSSLPNKEAYAKNIVDASKIESHDEVVNTTSSDALQGSPELWKCMESCEANNIDAASHESDCSYNWPAKAEPCQGCDIDVTDFLEITHSLTAKPREVLEKFKLVSSSKQSIIDLESQRKSSASCSSKKTKLNNIANSPAKDTHFGTHCLSETLGGQSSLPMKEALAKHTVDVLKMESHEELAITSSPDALQGKLELLKCMESCAANNIDAASPYECDFSYDWHAEGEPRQGGDVHVREFLKIDQGATAKPGEVLEKIKFLSPSEQSCFDLEDERNSSTSCISKKTKLNNNIADSPAKDVKHFGIQRLSETSDDHSSLPIKQAYAEHSVDILEVESQDGSIPATDTLIDAVPCEVKASFSNNTIDPVEEISRKLINFCISSSRKAAKSNILNTPASNSAGISNLHSSVGHIRDKENTQSTKMKHSSKRKMRSFSSAGSIRRPLQSVTNQMID